jgi:hypothetical protein
VKKQQLDGEHLDECAVGTSFEDEGLAEDAVVLEQ